MSGIAGRADGASTSKAAADQGSEEEDEADDNEQDGGADGSGGAESDSDDSSEGDEHAYKSDSDSDAEGMQKMLQLLEQDADVPPEQLMVSGKRQRKAVDYAKLNDEMFGSQECYDGEGADDDFKAYARKQRKAKQSP
jgi:hypothetical protein